MLKILTFVTRIIEMLADSNHIISVFESNYQIKLLEIEMKKIGRGEGIRN